MPGAARPLRVALVSSDVSLQSGAACCLLALARGLQQRDEIEPVLYLSDDGPLAEQARRDGLRVRITGVSRPSLRKGVFQLLTYVLTFPWHCARLAFWLRKDRIDLVHANEFIEFQAGVAGRLVGLPRLYHIRWLLDQRLLYRMLARITALLGTDLVAVSRAAAEACFRACGRRPNVVYDPGPDTERFKPSASPDAVLQELALPPDTQLVTLVSKLIPQKGQEASLRAAAEVVEDYPAVRFLIVGGEIPGAEGYARRLCRLAEQKPLKGRVVFTGPRRDVPRLLGASAIAAHLPSFPEAFPGVVLEAMSCGCAVVAAAAGGIPEQITDGVDGVLVPPGDIEAVAAALDALLSDPERRRRMGQDARASILTRLSLRKHTTELVSLYGAMLEREPTQTGGRSR